MNNNIINFVLFQIGWFACVLGASYNMPYTGFGIALLIIAIHFYLTNYRVREAMLLTAVTVLGYSWDSFLVQQNVIEYAHSDLNPFAPLWIAAMWAMFATTLNASLNWLQERFLLSAILGAIFGPIAYYSAYQLGAISVLQLPNAMLLQAIAWALFMPFFVILNKVIYPISNTPILEQK